MKVITSVRVDDELWKKVKIHAIEKDETVSDMLERLLKEELERKDKKGKC